MKNKCIGVLKKLKNFWKNADAQDLVEYALLLLMVALAVAATVKSFSASITNAFTQATIAMVELPGNATGVVAAGAAGIAAVDNVAATVNNAAGNAAQAAANAAQAAANAAQAAANAEVAAAEAAVGTLHRRTPRAFSSPSLSSCNG